MNTIFYSFLQNFFNFLPNFFTGLLILIIGLTLASLLKRALLSLFSFARLDSFLEKMKLISRSEVKIWEDVLSEILKWTVVILFLIPTLEVWNLSRATIVINQFLFYLPNVIVAVVIGFVGLLASNLGYDLVKHSVKTLGATSANTLSVFTKWAIVFFTVLIVLNQLGVAQDLVRILFTGIVVMVALAGGLAFGLGGKDIAKEILEEIRKKFK
ncbi:hypothetical protein A2963_00235 [Candidatus Roizmanbacteria bacterium RIFCSPLOWO2_01_FULL_40_13]|nr:MAG: hypothetical protein A2963_00235 [Candidatus Roizmanbacteria bacterium RIFCSPLOWO2_01_FULL_40_13]